MELSRVHPERSENPLRVEKAIVGCPPEERFDSRLATTLRKLSQGGHASHNHNPGSVLPDNPGFP